MMLLVTILTASQFSVNQLYAQTINQERVDQQLVAVNTQLKMTLTEYVKLLQMILIQRLEGRLLELQT